MSETKPRAFPSNAIDDRFGGMELRDWFAGCVVEQCIRNSLNDDGSWEPDNIAYHAYIVADAMMAEREKRNGS